MPEIGLQDIRFTTIVENLLDKSRGEVIKPMFQGIDRSTAIDRSLFRESKKYKAEFECRDKLHKVPTESLAARGLFQFAVTCVIKNNKMKRGEKKMYTDQNTQAAMDQFQMNQAQKNAHYSALKYLLEKALSYQRTPDEAKDKAGESQQDGSKKEEKSKKDKEVTKNL